MHDWLAGYLSYLNEFNATPNTEHTQIKNDFYTLRQLYDFNNF